MTQNAIAEFYRANPRMVSSPFGGVDGLRSELLGSVLDQLGIEVRGKRVLDVGCGRGFAQEWVEAQGGEYVGTDFVVSRKGFALAKSDAAALPFADASFDCVFCIDAFEHFPYPVPSACEFHRVLAPGGSFFLSAPNYGNVAGLVKWACEAMGWYDEHTWAPFGRWQPQELEMPVTARYVRRVFRRAGFRQAKRIGHAPEVGLGLFPWIDHPNMPEAVQYRLQRLFGAVGPAIVTVAPWASLHNFWKMDA